MLIVDSQSHIWKNGLPTNPAHRDLLHHHGSHRPPAWWQRCGLVLLVLDSPALYALPDGVHGQSERAGRLLYSYTLSGRRCCAVLSHKGDTRPLGSGAKALINHPRATVEENIRAGS